MNPSALPQPALRPDARWREGQGGVETAVLSDGRLTGVTITSEGVRSEWEFPHDPALPFLAQLVDPALTCQVLTPICPGIDVTAVDVMRYRAGRRCTLKLTAADRYLAVKVFHDEEKAAAVEQVMRRCTQDGLARVATVIGRTGPIIVQSWESGRSAEAVLAAVGPGEAEAARAIDFAMRAGRLTAQMHAIDASGLAERPSAEQVLSKLTRRNEAIRSTSPALAADADAVITQLGALPPGPGRRAAFVHGDLKPAQFLVADDATSCCLLDFDHGGVGYAAHDVASFLAALDHAVVRDDQPLDVDVAAHCGNGFLRGYGSHLPDPEIAWFRAAILLRKAHRLHARDVLHPEATRLVRRAAMHAATASSALPYNTSRAI